MAHPLKTVGFPLLMCVEHGALQLLQAVTFIQHDPKLKSLPEDQVIKTLAEVGFDEALRSRLLTELSGGWKMKLALARAMLLNADILLLDGARDVA